MTLDELAKAVHPLLSWDEVTYMMGKAWAIAQKKYKGDPTKLYYAWESIMTIYWEQYEVNHAV